ncbi:MAG: division plane positioning ATPase MipZ, partial [Rhodospirillaceae bacterium]
MTKSRTSEPPKIIVFGNEKGGTGKSTLAMHVAVALLNRGLKVGTVDLDTRQGTFTRYAANRAAYAARSASSIPQPSHHVLPPPSQFSNGEKEFKDVLKELSGHDAVVIDTPGYDSPVSLAGHSCADIVVTPINDSLIDLDVLATVDPATRSIKRPSHYAERVWRAKQLRARRDGGSIEWFVVRNRMGQLDARNKRLVGKLIDDLSKR